MLLAPWAMPLQAHWQYNGSRHQTIEASTMQQTREIIAYIAIQQLLLAVALVDRWANQAPTKVEAK
jgi:hypothetical protein